MSEQPHRHTRGGGYPEVFGNSWIPGRASYRQLARNDTQIIQRIKRHHTSLTPTLNDRCIAIDSVAEIRLAVFARSC